MNKSKKILLGIATLWPILSVSIVFGLTFSFLINPTESETMIVNAAHPGGIIAYLLSAHILTSLLTVILLVIYIRDVLKNDKVPETRKTLWTLLLLFGNVIAMPIYYYLYIWKKAENKSSVV